MASKAVITQRHKGIIFIDFLLIFILGCVIFVSFVDFLAIICVGVFDFFVGFALLV